MPGKNNFYLGPISLIKKKKISFLYRIHVGYVFSKRKHEKSMRNYTCNSTDRPLCSNTVLK